MEIREAVPEDFGDLLKIGYKFFEFNAYRRYTSIDDDSLVETFFQLYEDHVLLVVEHEAKVIGCAAAFIAPLYWNHNYKQGVEAFWWIDPEHRNSGIGTKLRKELQAAAVLKGADFWNMIALKESMHAEVCASYEKAGMTHVETVYMKVL